MPLTPDAIQAVFPYPTLTRIEGEPSWPKLRQIQKELNANAASVPSNLGSGKYGLLALTMTPTAYSNICSTPVLAPRNPGAQPNPADIAAAVNAYTITEIHKKHEKEVKI